MTEPSEADKQLQGELDKLSQERQIILTRLERKRLEKINQTEREAESSTSSRKRSARNLTSDKVKSIKVAAKDSIVIAGVNGTLGSRLLELGHLLEISDKKSSYIAYLCKNSILDMTDLSTSSQISLIGDRAKAVLIRYLDDFGGEGNSDHNIVEITKPLSKLKNKNRTEDYYHKILLKHQPKNDMERNVLNIYKYIIEQHLFRSFMLKQNFIDSCSEQSLNIKFWSYLFECFFGGNPDLFLQWGETKAADCNAQSLDFKLDLRITVNIEQEEHEVATAELAKSKSTTESKLYNDKVKLALVTKCHLNSLLKSMPYIPKSRIKDVKVPNIQIMGLTCHVKALSLIDKGVYLSQDVFSFDYPRTRAQIQDKGIQKIIHAFSIVDDLFVDIKEFHKDYSQDNSSKMDSLIKGKKKHNFVVEDWISEVVSDENVGHDH